MTTETLIPIIEELMVPGFKSLQEGVATRSLRILEEYKIRFGMGLKNYYEAVLDKYLTIKTIIDVSAKLPLEEVYVPITLTCQGVRVLTKDVNSLFSEHSHFFVLGLAGAGKSTLTKYMFTQSIRQRVKIPVLIELRNLNLRDTLVKSLCEYLEGYNFQVTLETMDILLLKGAFTFFFDGLDEMPHRDQEQFSKQIQLLRDRYHHNHLVIVSRPFEFQSSFESFDLMTIDKLSLDQSIDLVSKLRYDPNQKQKFATRLASDLYTKNESFASNPLLLTIMLMTFNQYGDFSPKIHVFYQQAFETLFQKHDANKAGVFTRRTRSLLSMYDFEKIFSLFCYFTAYQGQSAFLERDLNLLVRQVFQSFQDIKVDVELFIADLVQSTSLLYQEGPKYVFVHRSFQEYFAAKYIVFSLSRSKAPEVLSMFAQKIAIRQIFTLIHDMNAELIESSYILPCLEDILEKLKRSTAPAEFTKKFICSRIGLNEASKQVHFNGAVNKDIVEFLSLFTRLYDLPYAFEVCDHELLRTLPSEVGKNGVRFYFLDSINPQYSNVFSRVLGNLDRILKHEFRKVYQTIKDKEKKRRKQIEDLPI